MAVKIHPSRKAVLADEFDKPYFQQIKEYLREKKQAGVTIYPPGPLIFNAFNTTPFDAVKVVILGQDPYHGPGQAHGLSFSVPDGVPIPPSLANIYKEIAASCGGEPPPTGNLTHRAEQGVLLLNSILTVSAHQPASHRDSGWEIFTDAVIRTLSERKEDVIFLLRGNFAKAKARLIDATKHTILTASHPSPFSAHKGFFGCNHFSQVNDHLVAQNQEPIQRFS